MDKKNLVLKYFQKKDQLTVRNKEYQQSLSFFFQWLIDNDQVNNDRTSKFFPNQTCTSKIISKDKGILTGIEEIKYLLKTYTRLSFKSKLSDGQEFKEKETIAQISGKSHAMFAYERTILNILQRMSGIATETSHLINLINLQPTTYNLQPFIAATRKTPWGLLDKKAVAIGGGLTHRLDLSDGILIKDNHLLTIKKQYNLATIEEAIEKALEKILLKKAVSAKVTSGVCEVLPRGGGIKDDSPCVKKSELIEIEVETEKQAVFALKTFQKLTTYNPQPTTHYHPAIMFDNFSPSRAQTLLSNLSDLFDLSQIIFEASGGINEKNIKQWAKTGADLLSVGALTHSSRAANLSLEF